MENIVKQTLHKHKFRQRALEKCLTKLIEELKDDPTREGLIDTPTRVWGLISRYLDGQRYSNDEIVQMFNFTTECPSDQLIHVKGIKAVSVSELTLIPYRLDVEISYITNGCAIGTSKLHKLVDLCTKRLRVQEILIQDIYEVLSRITHTEDIKIKLVGHQIDGEVCTEKCYGAFKIN